MKHRTSTLSLSKATGPLAWFGSAFVAMVTLCLGVVVLSAALSASVAFAQAAPDVRNIRPAMMLLVDSSGSMERLPSCVCTTPVCSECLPSCGPGEQEKNRWSTMLEALTGSYENYMCSIEERSGPQYSGEYDELYFVPHVRRDPAVTQANDGILDVYHDRVKFGLMTFDGVHSLIGQEELVPPGVFMSGAYLSESQGVRGMFSYGEPKELFFPGCAEPYMIDNGARNTSASSGALISVGGEEDDPAVVNGRVQDALLAVRPYGPTPIAGMLEDMRFFVDTHPDIRSGASGGSGDPFYACRSRYAVLITDGYPNADFRGDPFGCEIPGYTCPYPLPEETAADLCRFSAAEGRCTGVLDGLFVIGFDLDDPAAVSRLQDIADAGGTQEALFANNKEELMARLSNVLDRAQPGTTTRTAPAFSTSNGLGAQMQMEFNTGFRLGRNEGDAWSGVLERRRTVCEGVVPTSQEVTEADRFHEVLNRRTARRRLLTVIPDRVSDAQETIVGETEGLIPESLTMNGDVRVTGYTLRDFDETIPPDYFGLSSNDVERRNRIVDWLHAENNSGRDDNRMGDIYHSSPVVVGPPDADIRDASYNLFRQRPDVADRPKVIYVGSNDGLLHAIVAEDYQPVGGDSPYQQPLTAGEELWGFIPPVLLSKLNEATASHQWMVDGTPVVKDMFFARLPGETPNAEQYHTVLVMGLRGGGGAYFALDVTNPLEPRFLWQFAHRYMGDTYGRPAMAQILSRVGGQIHERGIVLLPGGKGTPKEVGSGGGATAGDDGHFDRPLGCPAQGKGRPPVNEGTTTARSKMKCWDKTGRFFFFVDAASGETVEELDDKVFPTPLVGGVSLFTGEVGTTATRAFISDADGVIWRISFDGSETRTWDATAFHDVFWDAEYWEGQPSYDPPVLSTDAQGRVVVMQATGDIDLLDDSTAKNKVISVTEVVEYDDNGQEMQVSGILNWEIALEPGEQVTGPLDLFDGRVFFASFQSAVSPADMCGFGQSRLWGVTYVENEDPSAVPAYPKPGMKSVEEAPTYDAHFLGPYANQIILGVGITQAPSCLEVVDTSGFVNIANSGGGDFRLVAQVSGANSASPDGGSVNQIVRNLSMMQISSSIEAWAGSVD